MRQTNYLMKDGPGFVQYIVEKRASLGWTPVFQGPDEQKAIEHYGFLTGKWSRQARYEMKMKRHMAIVNPSRTPTWEG